MENLITEIGVWIDKGEWFFWLGRGAIRLAILLLGFGILRLIFWRRISPRGRVWLWLLVPAVLFWPGTPTVSLSTSSGLGRLLSGQTEPSPVMEISLAPFYLSSPITEPAGPPAETSASSDNVASPVNSVSDAKEGASSGDSADGGFWGFFSRHPARMIFAVWLTGVLVMAGYWLWTVGTLRRLIRSATPVDEEEIRNLYDRAVRDLGVRRPLPLLWSAEIRTPILVGVGRPCRLLLPASWNGTFPPERLYHVLLHETAHLRRRDLTVGQFAFGLLSIFWFHPLVWLGVKWLHADQEEAADSDALAILPDPALSDYVETLYEAIRRQRTGGRPVRFPGVTGIMTDVRQTKRRIRSLALFGKRKMRWLVAGAAIVALLGGLSLVRCELDDTLRKRAELAAGLENLFLTPTEAEKEAVRQIHRNEADRGEDEKTAAGDGGETDRSDATDATGVKGVKGESDAESLVEDSPNLTRAIHCRTQLISIPLDDRLTLSPKWNWTLLRRGDGQKSGDGASDSEEIPAGEFAGSLETVPFPVAVSFLENERARSLCGIIQSNCEANAMVYPAVWGAPNEKMTVFDKTLVAVDPPAIIKNLYPVMTTGGGYDAQNDAMTNAPSAASPQADPQALFPFHEFGYGMKLTCRFDSAGEDAFRLRAFDLDLSYPGETDPTANAAFSRGDWTRRDAVSLRSLRFQLSGITLPKGMTLIAALPTAMTPDSLPPFWGERGKKIKTPRLFFVMIQAKDGGPLEDGSQPPVLAKSGLEGQKRF